MSALSASNAATIEIGELQAAESEAAVALWDECGLVRPWNDPRADVRLALEGPSSTVLAARAGARLAATVLVGWDGHRGWIYYLAASPRRAQAQSHGARRKRGGRRLL